MRCRKVRSSLSAYCNDELVGRSQLAVREHLASCAACRREAEAFTSIRSMAKEIPAPRVSDDFNTRLLNQIAQERFQETRTQAYLPRRAPVIAWGRLVPAMASAMAVVLVTVGMVFFGGMQSPEMTTDANTVQPDYLTVQPTNNPHMTVNLQKDWSFDRQLALAERLNRMSRAMGTTGGFGNNHLTSATRSSWSGGNATAPFGSHYFRVRPVHRMYQSTTTQASAEGEKVY